MCRSGSAADTQNISAYVTHYLRQHEMDVGEPDVATAANIAMQIVYGNKARIDARPQSPAPLSACPDGSRPLQSVAAAHGVVSVASGSDNRFMHEGISGSET